MTADRSVATGETAGALRITGLDGLRGLASLIVVFRHTFNAVAMPVGTRRAFLEGPLAPLLNAQGAVQLFFVLSGYVLASSLSRNRERADAVRFYVRRVFRIYPPYIGAVLFALAAGQLYQKVGPKHGITPWVDSLNRADVTTLQLLGTFTFPGQARGLLPQGWTLEIEMIFSLLMPLMFLLARRVHWGLLALLCLVPYLLPSPGTLRYGVDFALGIALFLERDRLARWASGLPPILGVALVALGVVIFGGPLLLGWHVPLPKLGILFGGADPRSMLLVGIGAASLIFGAVHLRWMARALSTPPAVFLGRISFSLYLVHWAVISVVATRLPPRVGGTDAWILLGAVLALSIPLSALGYYGVERPAIRAGRWLGRRVVRTSS